MIRSVTVTNYLGKSITLELGRPEESGFIVKNITGLGPDKATVNITEYTSEDGGIFNSARKSSKNIVMELEFMSYKETIEDVRQKSYEYFPLKREVNLKILTDNHELEIDGIVESNEPDIFSKNEGCQISIICPNPYFREIYKQETFSSGDKEMFEFPFWNDLEPILGDVEKTRSANELQTDGFELFRHLDSLSNTGDTSSGTIFTIANVFGSEYQKYDIIRMTFKVVTFADSITYRSNIYADFYFYGPSTKFYLFHESNVPAGFSKEYDITFPKKEFEDAYGLKLYKSNFNTGNNYGLKMMDIKIYGAIAPSPDPDPDPYPELDYPKGTLVDKSLPYYTFEKDGQKYNLRGSKGIIFGELLNNSFKHIVNYKGTIETGFIMTIEFTKDFMSNLTGEFGYLVIKNPRYLNKKMVIDLTLIKDLIPKCSCNYYAFLDGTSGIPEYMYDSTGGTIPSYVKEEDLSGPKFGKKGDVIIIDTRKGNKGLYYQSTTFNPVKKTIEDSAAKPYRYYILWAPEIEGDWGIHYDLNDVDFYDKINVLSAINRDAEWFQIGPGYNILQIHHTFNPQTLYDSDYDKDLLQASSIDVKVENTVYYEGV